jgi:hypothetical protein
MRLQTFSHHLLITVRLTADFLGWFLVLLFFWIFERLVDLIWFLCDVVFTILISSSLLLLLFTPLQTHEN